MGSTLARSSAFSGGPDGDSAVIPELDIWRAANLMLKRYGENAALESAARIATS